MDAHSMHSNLLYLFNERLYRCGKNWILPQQIYANRFFWDSHWLEMLANNSCPTIWELFRVVLKVHKIEIFFASILKFVLVL